MRRTQKRLEKQEGVMHQLKGGEPAVSTSTHAHVTNNTAIPRGPGPASAPGILGQPQGRLRVTCARGHS